MPKGFTEQEKTQIREKMIQVGFQLFSTFGLKKTNVEDITRACGISKGAFYLFYESKEHLFMDLLEISDHQSKAQITEAFSDLEGFNKDEFKRVTIEMFAQLKNDPILSLFKSDEYEYLIRKIDPAIVSEHVANDAAYFRTLHLALQEKGIFREVDPDTMTIFSTAMYLLSLHSELDHFMNYEKMLQVFVDMFADHILIQ
ncbi:MAG: TetR/AcrR family transcriptional regulator [Anaerolineaceae bacterium]|nr:TetR/AcrR family transcriptional regulator [Anaerolineaceae bacterium]